eukprot:5421142-Heterocapsa_arctica.AAC.1
MLERLHDIIANRRADALDNDDPADVAMGSNEAAGPPRGTSGSVLASHAAEAETTRDLLDDRVLEGTTGWSDINR